ncbi:MAG: dTDP-4-dehydrorhamnose reductase [Acidimicrobiales bacterium]
MTKVVVTGSGGQLGSALATVFDAPHVELFALDRAALDLTSRDQVLACVGELRPAIIVNSAAWTAVDACEADPDRAFATNALGVRHVADAARRFGAHLVHISTDYVFDGTATTPYREWDATNPQSVYGRSKLAGEHEAGPSATIVRTGWLNGAGGSNFITTMLRLARERDRLTVVADQTGCPTFADDLAQTVRRLAVDRRPGIHHVTNQGQTTWFELAKAVVTRAGLDPGMVEPTTTEEYGAAAPRPAYSVLDNAALRAEQLPLLPPWQDSLDRLLVEVGL